MQETPSLYIRGYVPEPTEGYDPNESVDRIPQTSGSPPRVAPALRLRWESSTPYHFYDEVWL